MSIRSNGLSFFNVFTERIENQRTSASKGEGRKNTKPTKAVKTFGLSVGAENAKQIGGIFPTMLLKCAAVLGSPKSICTVCCVWLVRQL